MIRSGKHFPSLVILLVLTMLVAAAGCGRAPAGKAPDGAGTAGQPAAPPTAPSAGLSNPVAHAEMGKLHKTFAEVSWSWSEGDGPPIRAAWRYEGTEAVEGRETARIGAELDGSTATFWLAEDGTAVRFEEGYMVQDGELADMFRGMWFFGAMGIEAGMAESILLMEVLQGTNRDHEWKVVSKQREQVGGLAVEVTRYLFTPRELEVYLESVELHLAVADFGGFQLMVEVSGEVKAKLGWDDHKFHWAVDRLVRR